MQHPTKKISKRNRNIISGILVGIASIYAIASYFDLSQSEINSTFVTTIILVLGIMLLAITTLVLIKSASRLIAWIKQPKNK